MNIDDRLEENRKNYYRAISLLQDEGDILDALPSPEYQTFFPLMKGIISTLEEEYREYQSFGDDPKVLAELDSIQWKISICKSKMESVKKQSADDNVDSLASYPKRHLIYAKTAFRGTCLERDLKDIPPEYYDSILSTLDTLERGEIGGNTEKAKQLTQNKKLFGLYEIKEFKIRLIYRILSENMVYVMQVRMKKDDNSAIDQKELVTRKKNTEDEYMFLKEAVEDPIKREALIMEHDDIHRGIKEMLENTKRSGRVIKMTNKSSIRQIKNAQGLCVLEQTKLSYSRNILSILEPDPSLVEVLSSELDVSVDDLFHKLSGEEKANIVFYDQGLDVVKTYAKSKERY